MLGHESFRNMNLAAEWRGRAGAGGMDLWALGLVLQLRANESQGGRKMRWRHS